MAARTGGTRGESGAAVVEFALVGLFLFVLVGAAFDYGMAWRTGLGINEASRTGARVGSAMGDQPSTDYYILSGAKSALESSGKLDGVERVVIFRSAVADGTIPAVCKTATSTSQECVIVDGATFQGEWSLSDFNSGAGEDGCFNLALSANWCPGDRESAQLDADYLGVWIRYRQDHFFPISGDRVMIERQSIMRLEPRVET